MARAEREQHKGGVEHMRRRVSPKVFSAFWESRFLGQIRRDVPVTEPISYLRFELEGNELVAVEVGHTDTHGTTALDVPSIAIELARVQRQRQLRCECAGGGVVGQGDGEATFAAGGRKQTSEVVDRS